jgi:hypothetical protein
MRWLQTSDWRRLLTEKERSEELAHKLETIPIRGQTERLVEICLCLHIFNCFSQASTRRPFKKGCKMYFEHPFFEWSPCVDETETRVKIFVR